MSITDANSAQTFLVQRDDVTGPDDEVRGRAFLDRVRSRSALDEAVDDAQRRIDAGDASADGLAAEGFRAKYLP